MTRVTKLEAKNFRCLEEFTIEFDNLTAIVGPNGSGKTSIVRALDLVLGDAWPSLRSFRIPQDFTNFDTRRHLTLTVSLEPPYEHEDALKKMHLVTALRLSCKQYKRKTKKGEVGDLHVDFEPVDEKGKVPLVASTRPRTGEKPQFKPLLASSAMRDEARIILIDHKRSLVQHLPSIRGSALARLLEPARLQYEKSGKEDFNAKYEAAMEALRSDKLRTIESVIGETTKRMLGFMGARAVKDLDIAFGFADPANPFNSLRLTCSEGGLLVPGEELGLGVQSAMVVGIFEALRQLGATCSSVVIEEPEMYLHPQAQRYFFKLLCEMSERADGGCQVIYTTHSPVFADVNCFEALRLVRRESGMSSKVSWVSGEEDRRYLSERREGFKLARPFDSARNELLFATRVLLTEGIADRVAVMLVAEKLGYDLDGEGCAVIDCGGKLGIPLIARLCRALGLPTFVLHDSDVRPGEEGRPENEEIVRALGYPSRVFVTEPSLENLLGICATAKDKPRLVAAKIRETPVDSLPENLVRAVKALMGT